MNPTQRSPNAERKFVPGTKYWLRESDGYVMPRSMSPYEKPEGYVAVIAVSETDLDYDNTPLALVPRDIDPTDPHMVGAAVSFAGNHTSAQQAGQSPRPMPVTLPRATDDHIVRQQQDLSLTQFANARGAAAAANVTEQPDGGEGDAGEGEGDAGEGEGGEQGAATGGSGRRRRMNV